MKKKLTLDTLAVRSFLTKAEDIMGGGIQSQWDCESNDNCVTESTVPGVRCVCIAETNG